MKVLHCFADTGVESEALSAYGEVTRVGLDPEDTPFTDHLIQADARGVEFDTTFDLGLFHPPCQRWTNGAAQHQTRDNHKNLIPVARKLANEYCSEYIIENVPKAPLENPVELTGEMFGLPIHYKRAFETSYHVEQPRQQTRLCGGHDVFDKWHDTGGWYGSYELWQTVKGYSGDYDHRQLKRSGIPRAYINYLVRPLL